MMIRLGAWPCEIGDDDVEGSRLRLPEASQTPPGAASSATPSFAHRLEAYATMGGTTVQRSTFGVRVRRSLFSEAKSAQFVVCNLSFVMRLFG
jgi:hypothetical protein